MQTHICALYIYACMYTLASLASQAPPRSKPTTTTPDMTTTMQMMTATATPSPHCRQSHHYSKVTPQGESMLHLACIWGDALKVASACVIYMAVFEYQKQVTCNVTFFDWWTLVVKLTLAFGVQTKTLFLKCSKQVLFSNMKLFEGGPRCRTKTLPSFFLPGAGVTRRRG
jgi:hypothetical protein